MEEEAKREVRLFPSPERIDKVEESMENLEVVVRERNKAYHLLETGETGERPGAMQTSALGLKFYYKYHERPIPKVLNTKWKKEHDFYHLKYDPKVESFLSKYREQLYLTKRRKAV